MKQTFLSKVDIYINGKYIATADSVEIGDPEDNKDYKRKSINIQKEAVDEDEQKKSKKAESDAEYDAFFKKMVGDISSHSSVGL